MRRKKSDLLKVVFTKESLALEDIVCETASPYKDKELKQLASKFVLNGEPTLSVIKADGEYRLLAGEKEYFALVVSGAKRVEAKVYCFDGAEAEMFAVAERIKEGNLPAIDEAYLMKRLVEEFGITQETVSALTGYSRPAVANTLRLLTLAPEVLGLIESGALSAGHARALVKVPKDKQYSFACSMVESGCTVREAEKTVGSFLDESKKLQRKEARAKREELKGLVERLRLALRTKVTLVGNGEKGRITIDYTCKEDLLRLEELLLQGE